MLTKKALKGFERFSHQVEKPARKNHSKIFDITSFQVNLCSHFTSDSVLGLPKQKYSGNHRFGSQVSKKK